MKNLLWLTVFVAMLFITCSDDEDQYVLFEKSEIEISSEFGEYNIDIDANCQWSVIANTGHWLSFDKYGTHPNMGLILKASANDTYSERIATITIQSENGSSKSDIKIIQKENKGIVGDIKESEYSGEKQEITIDLKTNIDNISIDTPDWITIQPTNRALSDKSYKFTLLANESGTDRIGDIVFSGEGKSWKYTVKQKSSKIFPISIHFKEGDNVVLKNKSDFTLTPIFTPTDCTEKELEWTSSNTNVVTVSDGVLKVIGNGDAKVMASSKFVDVNASINVKVDMDIFPSEITFNEGESLLLTDNSDYVLTPIFTPTDCTEKELEWTSSNTNVVTVSDGMLKIIGNGNAKITAKSKWADISTSIDVKVKIKLEQIIPISQDGYYLYSDNWGFGHTDKLRFKITPSNAYLDELVYTSSNPEIVFIENGYLTANKSKAGSSQITIQDLYSGQSTFVDITVDRCFFYAGNTGIAHMTYGLVFSFGGCIYSNNESDVFDIVSLSLLDKDGSLIALPNYIGSPSNKVTFNTEKINVTSLLGIETLTSSALNRLSEFKFLICYKYNGGNEEYWDYIDIEAGTNVKI